MSPTEERKLNSRQMAKWLLLGIENRGPQATGAAWYDPQGKVLVQKGPMKASDFIRDLSMWKRSSTAILHTRMATQGDVRDNVNNHPVQAGHIVGVHNGVIYNEDELFKKMNVIERRTGLVDTEAIFASIAWGMEMHEHDGNQRLPGVVEPFKALEYVEGSAAVAWFDVRDPYGRLNIARVHDSPVCMAQTEAGSFFFASTNEALNEMAAAVNLDFVWRSYLDEGEYIQVYEGAVIESKSFTPHPGCNYGRKWWDYDDTNTAFNKSWKRLGSAASNFASAYQTPQLELLSQEQADDIVGADIKETTTGYMHIVPDGNSVKNDLSSTFLHPRIAIENDMRWYYEKYEDRVNAQVDYFRDISPEAELQDRFDLHVSARPGDWCETALGDEAILAQVYTLPQSFPDGTFVLRAMVKNPDREGGYEVVLLARLAHEFFLLDSPAQSACNDQVDDFLEKSYA